MNLDELCRSITLACALQLNFDIYFVFLCFLTGYTCDLVDQE